MVGHNPALSTPSAGGSVPGPACTTCLQSPGLTCADWHMPQWRSRREWAPQQEVAPPAEVAVAAACHPERCGLAVTLQWKNCTKRSASSCSLLWDGRDRVVVLVRSSLMTLYALLCVADAMVVRK